ncbi:hypothetical protein [Stenotrophomonas muris]|uniref:hypothetical protein n=1 Tax=Stenotrophomonas muris TaxID=2963283 RepID=UPI0039C699AD
MTTDNKTLADVQPGGRVRLRDQAERARFEAFLSANPLKALCAGTAWEVWQAALSAQPSPGGQGELVQEALEYFERAGDAGDRKYVAAIREALAARQAVTMDDALAAGDGTLHGAIDHWQERALRAEAELAARQPVGEPVDDYDSAFQEADRPPYLVDAAGIYALESFLTVADEFRRSAEPYIEAINEGACGGEDEVSQAFDTQLARAKEAASRSVVYAAPPAQAVDYQAALLAEERSHSETIDQRDRCEEVADELADHIARITGVATGEHSSANCPWQNAIDAAEEYKPAQAVDLGQFRQPVQDWLDDAQASMEEHGDSDGVFGYAIEEGTRLLALIDKAVGNG